MHWFILVEGLRNTIAAEIENECKTSFIVINLISFNLNKNATLKKKKKIINNNMRMNLSCGNKYSILQRLRPLGVRCAKHTG